MTFSMSRRGTLGVGLGAAVVCSFPGLSFAAAPTDCRFVFIIQRGAADGLSILQPTGDPALASLRGALVEDAAHRLDGLFALHPALTLSAAMFAAGEARGFHAVATAYRDRSHFDGQNVLESGAASPYAETTGWIGRLLPLLPRTDASALALAPAVPLALRGPTEVATYAPNALPAASDDFSRACVAAICARRAVQADVGRGDEDAHARRRHRRQQRAQRRGRRQACSLAAGAGRRGTRDDARDRRLGHAQRAAAAAHRAADRARRAAGHYGPGWGRCGRRTLALVATEFGRTAAVNGTAGTDHGTASAVLMFGGALPRAGRVVADWPGLGAGALYQDRDLRPTARFGTIAAQALAAHYAIDPSRLAGLFA